MIKCRTLGVPPSGGRPHDRPVLSTVADGIAHLELNRPEAANAFDMALATALFEAVEWAAGEDQVRAVLLTGSGPRFPAGGDVASFLAGDDVETELRHLALAVDRAVRALEGLAKPVVAAVHGAVAGAGLPLMLSADVVVADPRHEVRLRLSGHRAQPRCGCVLPAAARDGPAACPCVALTGEVLTAQGAQACPAWSRRSPRVQPTWRAASLSSGPVGRPRRWGMRDVCCAPVGRWNGRRWASRRLARSPTSSTVRRPRP